MDKKDQCIIMCLQEIGCNQITIEKYLKMSKENDIEGMVKMLSCIRCRVLEQIHEKQEKLDCLDYIIFKLKKDKK
ncbi:MAG: hypothetical protein HFG29_06730 [Eubacterium sp.]|nr:hypothetical protein [Eubacterium sp.]